MSSKIESCNQPFWGQIVTVSAKIVTNLAGLVRLWRHKRGIMPLRSWDDRMLKDIGLSRAELDIAPWRLDPRKRDQYNPDRHRYY